MGVLLCMKSRVGVLHSPVRRIAQAGGFPAFSGALASTHARHEFPRPRWRPCRSARRPAMSPRAPDGAPAAARAAWRLPALLPGVVSGAALQLLQPRLWPPLVYGALLCAALALGWCAGATATRRRHAALWAAAPALLAAGLAAAAMFAVCGLRAWGYMEQALAPALEGQDIRVTGLVAAMP